MRGASIPIALTLWLCSPVLYATAHLDNFARALQFLNAAYPDLRGHGHGLALSNNYWRNFDVTPRPLRSFALLVSPAGQTSHAPDQLLMTAHFEFAADDFIDEFNALSSRVLHADALREMTTMVLDRPTMTREAVGAALTAAGARFGPGRQEQLRIRAAATLGAVAFVTGPVKVVAVNWRQLDTTCWSVDVHARQGGTTREYAAMFEPFDGKLLHLKRGNVRAR